MSRSIEDRAAFHFLRYASVWEDADILCEALAPTARGGRVLSVASAGDNVLALLTADPAEVVAVDLSGPQLAALRLRIAAFRRLSHMDVLRFLGVRAAWREDRLATYNDLRGDLPTEARRFWDVQSDAIGRGVIHAGRFERYLRLFRRRILPLIHPGERIDRLMTQNRLKDQEAFYSDEWDTRRWRFFFRLFFSRLVMGRLGRDPAFFEHVEGSVGERLLERTRHALTAIPVRSNPYLTYIMTGNYSESALPRYLRAEHFRTIRSRLDRVQPIQGPVESAPGFFHAFNLSDVFEYMDPADHDRVYLELVRKARPDARLAYWNLLAERGVPAFLAERVEPMEELAADLHRWDRAWFYQSFHVDRIID